MVDRLSTIIGTVPAQTSAKYHNGISRFSIETDK